MIIRYGFTSHKSFGQNAKSYFSWPWWAQRNSGAAAQVLLVTQDASANRVVIISPRNPKFSSAFWSQFMTQPSISHSQGELPRGWRSYLKHHNDTFSVFDTVHEEKNNRDGFFLPCAERFVIQQCIFRPCALLHPLFTPNTVVPSRWSGALPARPGSLEALAVVHNLQRGRLPFDPSTPAFPNNETQKSQSVGLFACQ